MIDVKKRQDVWTVRLNRPDKANALTSQMLELLCETVEQAVNARAVILTGTGRVFCAGADLDAARAGLAVSPLWEQLSAGIAALGCPTVAALNGSLAGGAFGMALACDMRIAVDGAKFFYPVMRLGFLPQPSDPKRLAALIGPSRTKRVLMGGAKLTSYQALSYGLIDAISDADTLLDDAQALVRDAVEATPEHAAAIKAMIPTGLL
jgi:enoyl-CoA hydratase/carnithine racemase